MYRKRTPPRLAMDVGKGRTGSIVRFYKHYRVAKWPKYRPKSSKRGRGKKLAIRIHGPILLEVAEKRPKQIFLRSFLLYGRGGVPLMSSANR